jgi:glycosyl transferase family 25
MRTILINLDRSPDRLATMQREFSRAGLAFDRFSAVDGVDLPGSVRPFFCDATGKVISPLRKGEVGCYASHLAVWQLIASGRYGGAVLVCEDDMAIPEGFASFLSALLAAAQDGWDIIRLSARAKRAVVSVRQIDGARSLVRFSREPPSAEAYLLTPGGARKLLAPGIRVRPVDQDFRRPWAYNLQSFGVHPPFVGNAGFAAISIIDAMGGRIERKRRRTPVTDLVRRPLHSLRTLGFRQWLWCAAQNIVGRKLA